MTPSRLFRAGEIILAAAIFAIITIFVTSLPELIAAACAAPTDPRRAW